MDHVVYLLLYLRWRRYLVQEAGVHHIDLNFGCPVRKVGVCLCMAFAQKAGDMLLTYTSLLAQDSCAWCMHLCMCAGELFLCATLNHAHGSSISTQACTFCHSTNCRCQSTASWSVNSLQVTSRGGGSALPLRPRMFRRLVAAAVAAAGPDVPVTVKLRMGLSPELLTYMQVSCSLSQSLGQSVNPPAL